MPPGAERGVEWGGIPPPPLWEGSGEGDVRKFFVFLLKIPYFDTF